MPILVLGGTGTVGSQVVHELMQRGIEIRVLTRSAEKAAALPEGVTGVTGDLMSPATVRTVFDGIDRVFMANANTPSEMHEALMAVNGARMASVTRFVYLSIHNLDQAIHVPHFGAKLPVEQALAESGIDCAVIRANNFFQNDYWYRDAMLQYGVYPQPIGAIGNSRVDVRDIAEAAAVILTDTGNPSGRHNFVGPDILTGEHIAAVWSEALGKPIAYAGDDLEQWEQQALQFMPDWFVYDLRLMYAFFQQEGLNATPADIAACTELLGHPPRRFEDFAHQTARQWLPEA